MADIRPYRSTPVFDQDTLPASLRARHDTKAGVWGLIRVIEGELKLTYLDPPSEVVLTPGNPGLILPQQPHYVTPLGPMKMRVAFYDQPPGDRSEAHTSELQSLMRLSYAVFCLKTKIVTQTAPLAPRENRTIPTTYVVH